MNTRTRTAATLSLVACVLLAACGSSDPPAPATTVSSETTTTSEATQARTCPRPLPAHPILSVRKGEEIPVYASAGGRLLGHAGDTTELGAPTTFSVVKQRRCWYGVITPIAGNNELGWVHFDVNSMALAYTTLSIHADLSERRVEIRDGRRVIDAFTVSIGAPDTPTPIGRFAVTGAYEGGLNPVYGCCAVALSARQPSLPLDWPGGDEIAIHGWQGIVGEEASNGCLRAQDDDMRVLLRHVALGEPVYITA